MKIVTPLCLPVKSKKVLMVKSKKVLISINKNRKCPATAQETGVEFRS
jgi:hypothetical protein